jgi:hypothetical protein
MIMHYFLLQRRAAPAELVSAERMIMHYSDGRKYSLYLSP